MGTRTQKLLAELEKLSKLKKTGKAYQKQLEVISQSLHPLKVRALRFISGRNPKQVTHPFLAKEWTEMVMLGLAQLTAFNGDFEYLVVTEVGFKLLKEREKLYPELPL